MIARVFILLIVLILLPEWYIYMRYFSRRCKNDKVKKWLCWLPSILMVLYTIILSLERDFAPEDMSRLNIYLFLLGSWIIPKAVYSLCAVIGRVSALLRHSKKNWGNLVGLVLALYFIFVVLYGSTIGLRRLEVKRVDLSFKDLPASFEGYRMVLFSDAHVGSMTGSLKKILERDIDSINAQQPDIILFAGDLQNMQPSEIYPVQDILMKLKAKDGIYSVLGNHDYSDYINADPAIESANERELVNRQTRFGWTVLRNERQVIRRGKDDLVIAGEESGGLKRDTILYDKKKTMEGVKKNSFVIMMQHDPTVWRKDILPDSIPLTVSGHTHGGQYSFFGVRPTEYTYTEDCGLYQEGNCYLYVTKGIGALIPFRFSVSPEIVVITLHRK